MVIERDPVIACKGGSGHGRKGRSLVIGGAPSFVTPAVYRENKWVGTPLGQIGGLDIEVIVDRNRGVPRTRDQGGMNNRVSLVGTISAVAPALRRRPGGRIRTPDIGSPVRFRAHARHADKEGEILFILPPDT